MTNRKARYPSCKIVKKETNPSSGEWMRAISMENCESRTGMRPCVMRMQRCCRDAISSVRFTNFRCGRNCPRYEKYRLHQGGQQRYIRNNRKNGITKSPEYSRHVEYSGDFCKQDTGVEPAYSAWEADALPIDESCMNFLYYSTNLVDGKRFLKNLEIFYRLSNNKRSWTCGKCTSSCISCKKIDLP